MPDELEYLVLNYRRLSPAGHCMLRRRAAARAKALRRDWLYGLWRQFVAWQEQRSAIAQLRTLDDAALKDIGLHRSGIEAAVADGRAPRQCEQRRAFPPKPYLLLQRTG